MNMESLVGQFLISMPALQDGLFARSLVYLCQHDDRGAVGFIINKPMKKISIQTVLEQLGIEASGAELNTVLLSGGPVQPERGFVIHPANQVWRSTFEPSPGIAVTTSLDILEAIGRGEGPNQTLLALGYAGWEPGQLEDEIKANAWLTCDFDKRLLFETEFEDRWRLAAGSFGFNFETMVTEAGHA